MSSAMKVGSPRGMWGSPVSFMAVRRPVERDVGGKGSEEDGDEVDGSGIGVFSMIMRKEGSSSGRVVEALAMVEVDWVSGILHAVSAVI